MKKVLFILLICGGIMITSSCTSSNCPAYSMEDVEIENVEKV